MFVYFIRRLMRSVVSVILSSWSTLWTSFVQSVDRP